MRLCLFIWSKARRIQTGQNFGGFGAYEVLEEAMGYMDGDGGCVMTGAQRSDLKFGNPNEFRFGNGPQGDAHQNM